MAATPVKEKIASGVILLCFVAVGMFIVHMMSYGLSFSTALQTLNPLLITGLIAGGLVGWQFSQGKKSWGVVAGTVTGIGTVLIGWQIWIATDVGVGITGVVGGILSAVMTNVIALGIGLVAVEWQHRF